MKAGSTILRGRDRQLEIVSAAITSGRSCLIRGAAGMGKTALLQSAVAASARTARVGRAFELLAREPYFVLRDALGVVFVGEPPAVVPSARRALDGGVLCIDDLHWCDADTLAVVSELCAVVPVVATVRPDPGDAAELCARMSGLGDVVDLEPLDDASIRAILTSMRPGAPQADVALWTRDASGNPLFAGLAAASPSSESHPGDALLDAMVGRASAAELEVVARLALHGSPLPLTAAERASLRNEALVECTGPGVYRLRHDLIAAAVLRKLDRSRRAAIHAELAMITDDTSLRARHLAQAGDATAAAVARRAADHAPTLAARAGLLALAVECSETDDPPLRLEAAEALKRAGAYGDAIAVLEAGDFTDPDQRLRREVMLAPSYWIEARIPETRAAIQRGRALTGDAPTPELVELLTIEVGLLTRIDWDAAASIALGERVVELAIEARHGEGQARSALGLAFLMAGDARWLEEMERAGDLAREADDLHAATTAFDTVLFGNLVSGDPRKCRPLAERMIQATELPSPAWNGYFRAAAMLAALHVDGDYAAVVDQGPELLERPLTVRSREMATWTLALAYADIGRDADALATATRAVDRASDDAARSSALCALAETHWLAGRTEEASAAAARAAALPVVGYPGHVSAAVVGVWAAAELRQPISDTLRAAVDAAPPNLAGARHEMAALQLDDPGSASAEFERAAEAWRPASVRARVRASWAAGDAAARAGDTARARALLDAADRECERVGLRALQNRIDRTRHRADLPVMVRDSDGGLSRRQEDVLRRVASGATTADIARALGISHSTVETHVRAALRLTGAQTRRQASVQAETGHFIGAVMCTRPGDLERAAAPYAYGAHGGTTQIEALPDEPWDLHAIPAVSITAAVDDDAGAARVLLARLRGARVVVAVADDARSTAMAEALNRVGGVRWFDPEREPVDGLTSEEHCILAELAAGASADAVADSIGYSRRSIARRLSAIRSRLGTRSTAVAVSRWRTTTGGTAP